MKRCGVYFCLRKGEIVYIGQTIDFHQRVIDHKCVGLNLEYDTVRLIECSEWRLDEYETRWIKKFLPRENHTHKGRKKYNYYQKKIRPNAKANYRNKKNEYKMKFRIMTEKSIVGFGRYPDNRVEWLVNNKLAELILFYYSLSHISFCEELLIKLKITEQWRIKKPGTNKEFGQEFLNKVYPELVHKWEAKRDKAIHESAKRSLNGEIRNNTAERGRMRNHGHFN